MNLSNLNFSLKKFFSTNTHKNIKTFSNQLKKYDSKDWKSYIKYDNTKYYRNLVYSSENYDIYIMTWLPKQYADFHNHTKSGCLMKILSNNLIEYRKYNNSIYKNVLNENDINYIDSDIGIHKIYNDSEKSSMSLHIYGKDI